MFFLLLSSGHNISWFTGLIGSWFSLHWFCPGGQTSSCSHGQGSYVWNWKISHNLLASVQRAFLVAGLCKNTAIMAARGRCASAWQVYSSRLWHFNSGCRKQSLDPASAAVTAVADFLLSLFNLGLTMETIKNYHLAITSIHGGFPDDSSVFRHSTIETPDMWNVYRIATCMLTRASIGPGTCPPAAHCCSCWMNLFISWPLRCHS